MPLRRAMEIIQQPKGVDVLPTNRLVVLHDENVAGKRTFCDTLSTYQIDTLPQVLQHLRLRCLDQRMREAFVILYVT